MALIEQKALNPKAFDPKSVKVNITSGAGVEIVWADGHESSYHFGWLRDACPCATCKEERDVSGRKPGEAPAGGVVALPIFKPAMKPNQTKAVGKYAIQFEWNDGHGSGIYSWRYLREVCPCAECNI